MLEREYMQKWVDEILEIARGDWSNEILLNKLHAELKLAEHYRRIR